MWFGVTKKLTILGSTGSIGTSTLELVDACPDLFEISFLVAGQNHATLADQALKYRPKAVGIATEEAAGPLREALSGTGIEIVISASASARLATEPVDIVVASIVGLAGLPSVMAALGAGQTVALANKESLVSAGALAMHAAAQTGARILPVDSEHSAIFQCWMGWRGHALVGAGENVAKASSISNICLTASGGPFRERDLASFDSITAAQAVKHPNWSMGQKISVDSATMMNKGLEVIEAAWLFDLPESKIDVLVHPQVAIHGMVTFRDGSVIGQLGTADMKSPISYALAWPDRLNWDPQPLDLALLGRLEFHHVEPARYPCFFLARQAITDGGIMPAVLNAANEIAVEDFLRGRIGFTSIAAVVEETLASAPDGDVGSLEAVLAVDAAARNKASAVCQRFATVE